MNTIKTVIAPLILIVFAFSNYAFSEDYYSELTKPYDEKYLKLGVPYRKEFKDNVVYILPDARQNNEDPNNEVGGVDFFIDEEGRKQFEEAAKKMAQKTGGTMMYFMEGHPRTNGEFDYFVLPEDKLISGCVYTKGYTYPVNCTRDGEHIFQAGIDPQEKLDAIAHAQGISGEYNKIPKGYNPDGCQIMPDGTNHPCEETTVVDMISKQDSQSPINLKK